jgi:anti-sigma B factor antagonist
LKLGGEVDLSWSQDVRARCSTRWRSRKRWQCTSMAVSYIDSSGIAALVEGFQSARGKGGRSPGGSRARRCCAVLELARLDKVFAIFSDLAKADPG